MDEQNWLEKLGVIRDIGEIKTELVRLTAAQQEANKALQAHDILLHGDGQNVGIDKTVDRLDQLEKGRSTRSIVQYTAIVGLIIERIWALITHRGP